MLGAGTCGLLAIQALRALGCGEIVVLEVDPYRRQLARQLGAESVFDPGTEVRKSIGSSATRKAMLSIW